MAAGKARRLAAIAGMSCGLPLLGQLQAVQEVGVGTRAWRIPRKRSPSVLCVCGRGLGSGFDGFQGRADFKARAVEIIDLLKVQPELVRHAEIFAKAQGRVGGDVALSSDDLVEAVRRHANGLCQPGGGDIHLLDFVAEDGSGVDGCTHVGISFQW